LGIREDPEGGEARDVVRVDELQVRERMPPVPGSVLAARERVRAERRTDAAVADDVHVHLKAL
jgi:hypothetical protein